MQLVIITLDFFISEVIYHISSGINHNRGFRNISHAPYIHSNTLKENKKHDDKIKAYSHPKLFKI